MHGHGGLAPFEIGEWRLLIDQIHEPDLRGRLEELIVRLRRSDERYRSFVAQSAEGIYRFESAKPIPTTLPEEEQVRRMFDATLAECNDVMARMYGYQNASEMFGARLDALLPPTEQRSLDYLTAFVRSGYRLEDAESHEVDRHGQPRVFLNNLIGVVENGALIAAWGSQRDVTAQRHVEAQRARLFERTARLQEVTHRISLALSAEEVADMMLAEGLVILGAVTAAIWLVDSKGTKLELLRSRGYPPDSPARFVSFDLSERIPLCDAVRSGQPVWLESWEDYAARYPSSESRTRDARPLAQMAIACLPLQAEGRALGGVAFSFPGTHQFEDPERWFVQILTQQTAQALLRARRFEAVRASEEAARFLADATRLLSSSLDPDEVYQRFAQLAVPRLGDWCVIIVVGPDGQLVQAAAAHRDPEKIEFAKQISRRYPPRLDPSRAPYKVIVSGQPELTPTIPDELLERAASDPEHLRLLRGAGMKSAMTVPLTFSGRTFAAMMLISAETDRRYGEDDLRLATELASRAALAVENARLFREAERAVQLRDEFLSVASHELRTPLTPLKLKLQKLAAEAAKQPPSPFVERVRVAVETSGRQLERLSSLISDLLDVSRIVGGRFGLEFSETDLMAVVKEVIGRFESAAQQAGTTVELAAPRSVVGFWDQARLDQVVTNLVDNAIKYGRGRPVVVRIEENERRATLMVSDQGIGIAPEDQQRIFERFERAVSHRNYGGLGLGLYITRTIVEGMGGSIRVESSLGRGATFVVELPRGQRRSESP